MMRIATILILAGSLAVSAADKPTPKIERRTYRVTGLFDADRVKVLKTALETMPEYRVMELSEEAAEITLEFAPEKLFPGQKPERVLEIISEKVRNATGHTIALKPRRLVPAEKRQRVEIPVAGCDCKACCLAAYEAIGDLEGVLQATVSFKEGRVTAQIDSTVTNSAKLEEALRKRGVDVLKGKK